MSILQTEPAEQNNSKILPVKIKICFFSIVLNILLLCLFFLQELTFSREQKGLVTCCCIHTHTHTDWLQPTAGRPREMQCRVPVPAGRGWNCCQIPPGLLGQFSQKNSAAGEKIRPQAGHPQNHQKKCRKNFCYKFLGQFCQLWLKLGRN